MGRHATYDEVTAIRARLEQVLRPTGMDGVVEYSGRHTDASVARGLKVPKGAVYRIRREKFGHLKTALPTPPQSISASDYDKAWRSVLEGAIEDVARRVEAQAAIHLAQMKDLAFHIEECQERLDASNEFHNLLMDQIGAHQLLPPHTVKRLKQLLNITPQQLKLIPK